MVFVPTMIVLALVSDKDRGGRASKKEQDAAEQALYALHQSRRRAG
jgi:hypothetical protein